MKFSSLQPGLSSPSLMVPISTPFISLEATRPSCPSHLAKCLSTQTRRNPDGSLTNSSQAWASGQCQGKSNTVLPPGPHVLPESCFHHCSPGPAAARLPALPLRPSPSAHHLVFAGESLFANATFTNCVLVPIPAPSQGPSPGPTVEAATPSSSPSALTLAPLQQHLTHRTRISPHLGHSPTEHPHLSSLILKYQMQSYLRAQEAFTGCRTENGSSEGAKVVPFTLPQAGQCLHQPRGLTSVM
ncbi:unnamed protein product [Rangifer tarandus platyrhynchus]|uniref:Uncharacterized protein n=2 Tax=Rangifer tarandus platyrhynchus TaxID=3082113 RepID=A0AC59ZRV3_RANTA|nr:unnamed protein product [Rangifer tarandus platyrhynchus]